MKTKFQIKVIAPVIVLVLLSALMLASCMNKIEFKINFISDGQVVDTIESAGEETIQIPPAPVKEGFVFSGWYWDEGTWQRPFTASSLLNEALNGDMNVFAKWVSNEVAVSSYRVSFNSMGGTSVEEQSVVYGTLAFEPSEPTRDGFIFTGWYKEADYTTRWSFETDKVYKETTLYAKWASSGDLTGCEILSLTGFEQNDRVFSASCNYEQSTLEISSIIKVSANATYTVSADVEGKETIPSGTVTLDVGTNTFYILVTSGSGTNKTQYTIKISRQEPPTAKITLDVNGGKLKDTQSAELTVEIGKAIGSLPKPTKSGYKFTGWYKDGDETKAITESTIASEDMRIVALWEESEAESIMYKMFKTPSSSDRFHGGNFMGLVDGDLNTVAVSPAGSSATITIDTVGTTDSEWGKPVFLSQIQIVGEGVNPYILSVTLSDGSEKQIGVGNIASNQYFEINEEVLSIKIFMPETSSGADKFMEILGYEIPKVDYTKSENIAFEHFEKPDVSGSCYRVSSYSLIDGELENTRCSGATPRGETSLTITMTAKNSDGVYVNELLVVGNGQSSYTVTITYSDNTTEQIGIGSFRNNSFEIKSTIKKIEINMPSPSFGMDHFMEIIIK